MKNYKTHINELISVGLQEDIFLFDESIYSDEFQRIFDFYTETLSGHSDFGISPAFLFFNNETSVNAWAGKLNNTYIININAGTVVYLKQKYQNLKNFDIKEINSIIDSIGTNIETLMFEFSIHFTFYHEMAHLIQKSEFLELNMMEINAEYDDYVERRHLLELDADTFSSILVSAHILTLFETNFNKDMEKFCDLLKVLMSTGINYILSFNSNKNSFYLKKSTHPHPAIRISCIIQHLHRYCQHYLGEEKYTNEMATEVTRGAFRISTKIFDESLIRRYSELVIEKQFEIEEYVNYFLDLEKDDKSLSVYKWNQKVKQLTIK